MLIDTHAHLNFAVFKNDRDKVIRRALDNNVWFINVGSNYERSKKAVEIAQKYAEGIYAAIGLHPIHLQETKDPEELSGSLSPAEKFDKEKYYQLAQSPKVVAIGEIGLDYYHLSGNKKSTKCAEALPPHICGGLASAHSTQIELQKQVFVHQLELANEIDKPVIVHCREAHKDVLEILKKRKQKLKNLRGVIHSFSGRWSQAQEYFDLGFLIGLNGIITFARDYDKVIINSPLEKVLIETDCPYLTPIPFRGKRNEPLYVKYVAEKIAEIKNISVEEVVRTTTENARKLFSF